MPKGVKGSGRSGASSSHVTVRLPKSLVKRLKLPACPVCGRGMPADKFVEELVLREVIPESALAAHDEREKARREAMASTVLPPAPRIHVGRRIDPGAAGSVGASDESATAASTSTALVDVVDE